MTNPWESIKTPNRDVSAIRVDNKHPLDFFWAKDHLDRYLFIYEYPMKSKLVIKEPPNLEGIETISAKSSDSIARLILILKEKEDWELFHSLCKDLLKATEKAKRPETASSIILTRLRRWQLFLKKKRLDILPEEKIKGLIGELLFIRNQLIPKHGVTNAITFWQGPKGSPQDFNINDSAIEVKCQMGGTTPSIKISSAEQLYTQLKQLFVFVVTMGKSSIDEKKAINLNSLVAYIIVLLEKESSSSINLFQDLLLEAGYVYNKKYNDFNYIVSQLQVFRVKDNFPRIIPNDLKSGIIRLNYNISLANCAPFEIELKNWEY